MSNWLPLILTRIAGLIRRNEPLGGHYHDVAVPSHHHFALRLKRRYRHASVFEADPRERLVQFLREFGQRTFGSNGTLESLTLLEDTSDSGKRCGRYLVAFGTGDKMIWTVALSPDGAVSFDGTHAPA